MTNVVIKSAAANISRNIRDLQQPPAPEARALPDPRLAELWAQLEDREKALQRRMAENDRLTREAAAAYERGKAAGYEAGLQTADKREADRYDLLETGMERALAAYGDHRASAERLAVLVARECLDLMFGEHQHRSEFLYAAIRHQLDQLDAGSIVDIGVSAADFDDVEKVLGEGRRGEHPRVVIRRDPALAPSEVRIAMTLGELSIGVDQQWGRLRRTLGDLVEAAE